MQIWGLDSILYVHQTTREISSCLLSVPFPTFIGKTQGLWSHGIHQHWVPAYQTPGKADGTLHQNGWPPYASPSALYCTGVRKETLQRTVQMLERHHERNSIPLWHPAKGIRGWGCWQNSLVNLGLWSLHQLWRYCRCHQKLIENLVQHLRISSIYFNNGLPVFHCARLHASRLGMQSHLSVHRWTAEFCFNFKFVGLWSFF